MTLTKFLLFGLLVSLACAQDTTPQDQMISMAQRWGYGLATGLGLSLLGFVAAFILVLVGTNIHSENFKTVVKVLFALACGTLIGDAMIHIMGEAYGSSLVDPIFVSLVFILALLAFMMLEKLMSLMGITHNHWVEEGHDHGHQHKKENPKTIQQVSSLELKPAKKLSNESKSTVAPVSMGDLNDSVIAVQALKTNTPNKTEHEVQTPKGCFDSWKGKGSAGYMNLVGSLIHNFIDGLTIGLAFSTGYKHVYTPVVIAIFTHEIPRELGDVAILLESKFNYRQAILSNGIINLIAILGVIVGLSISGISDAAKTYVLVFVAGNFMFIAADIWRNLFKAGWGSNLLQFLLFAVGVGAMFGIKFLEDSSGAGN